MRMLTRIALAAPPLALSLALGGCGSDDEGGKVPTAGGDKKGGGASSAAADRDEMGVKFAQCLREHGVNVKDPEPGKGLQFTQRGGEPGLLDKAMEACRKYDPQANSSAGPDPRQEERGRKFAECMRKNGVEKFPDPKPGQRGIRITGEVGEDPDFQKAQKACQDVLGGGQRAGGGQ